MWVLAESDDCSGSELCKICLSVKSIWKSTNNLCLVWIKLFHHLRIKRSTFNLVLWNINLNYVWCCIMCSYIQSTEFELKLNWALNKPFLSSLDKKESSTFNSVSWNIIIMFDVAWCALRYISEHNLNHNLSFWYIHRIYICKVHYLHMGYLTSVHACCAMWAGPLSSGIFWVIVCGLPCTIHLILLLANTTLLCSLPKKTNLVIIYCK